jgi:RNA polymerase sigma factor (sigma-70 family)
LNSDRKIWDDFRNGEKYALSHIYHHHIQMLYRYGKKFTRDEDLIKDNIQELFFDLIRTSKNLGETDNISFYLMASFRRKLSRNRNKREFISYRPDDKDMQAEIIYSYEHELISREELTQRDKVIQNALAELSPKQREILFYRFTCGYEYEQICEIMSLQYDSARKQVSRAIKSLRTILTGSQQFLLFIMNLRKR